MIEHIRVTIESIDGNVASTIDRFGKIRTVPTNVMRAKGFAPAVGEEWIIDRALGQWTFAAWIDTSEPAT